MTKKLFVFSLLIAFVVLMAFNVMAADTKAMKNGKSQTLLAKTKDVKLPASSVYMDRITDGPVIWTDDFEGTHPNWVSDASWNHVATATGGRAFQPKSAWAPNTTNFNSASTAWNARMGLDEELDFIVSPVIHLPTEVTVEGNTSPLKGLKLGYFLDFDFPAGTTAWYHLIGPAEVWWHFTHTDPGAGMSSWLLEPHDVQHWRQWIATPDIDLTSATGTINLTFKHDYDSEVDFDYYSVDVSTNNFATYENLAWYVGDGTGSKGWTDVSLDLSAFAGKMIKIRFSSKGDYGTAEGFWVLDEIKVTDGTTEFFYDNGGEDGTTTMTAGGFGAPAGRFRGLTAGAQANPNWIELDAFELPGFGTQILPGDSIRIAIMFESDGVATSGRGLSIDDVTLYGIGSLPFDVAALGAKGFQTAAVGKLLAPEVMIANVGLNPITGTLRWQASITSPDGNVVFPGMIGFKNVTNFAPGDVTGIPTFAGREWLVAAPGDYNFKITVIYAADGNPKDNEISVPFTIWGVPFVEVVFQENFLPKAGEASLKDFGFTVVNGGGNSATGLNLNTWEYHTGLIYAEGGALLSWAWGNIDLGPDVTFPLDSSEVLDESLITPPIDISMLNPNATLFMQYYVYFRPAHPAVGPPFGAQTSQFLIDFSIDGGKTWYNSYKFVDADGQPVDLGSRLPNHYYGATQPIPFTVYLGTDLTPALKMGGKMLHVRITVKSENSYFIGCSIEDMVIYSGIGQANITKVADIPQDQGKQVRVSWMAPFNEFKTFTSGLYGQFETRFVTHYNLWRQVDETNFDFITTVPAHADKYYHFVAPTLQDGVDTYFMVSAHTNDPMIFINSKPVAGKSTDDLAPNAPTNLVAKPTDTTVDLAWEAPTNEEARYFTIYRGTVSGSYDKKTNIADLTFIDKEVTKGTTYYYTVTATDYAGNESEKSMEVNTVFTSVSESGSNIPTDYELAQNYPNPFNPATSIKFALPVAGHVTLKVMNIYGQEVATLVNETRAAGYHNVTWDASNVATGVYFYSIEAGNFKVTKKMILSK